MSQDDKQWRPLPISQWPSPVKVISPNPEKTKSPEPEKKTLQMNDGIPCGYQLVQAEVWTNGKDIVVTGTPDDIWPGYEDCDDDHPHNCDAMACGLQHVIARVTL